MERPMRFRTFSFVILTSQSFLCCLACHEVIDAVSGSTGHSLLAECTGLAVVAAQAAGTGAGLAEDIPELFTCIAKAERLIDPALAEADECTNCPEACALVLILAAATADFDSVFLCSQSLLLYMRSHIYFAKFEPHWLGELHENLPALVNARKGQCSGMRVQELDRAALPSPAQSRSTKMATSDQVAVLVAATPNKLEEYQPFINLWRCYALRHGLGFILETDDTEVTRPHYRAPNWMRWFAARKNIVFYKALLVVDPDQVIVPECWDISIPGLLGSWSSDTDSLPDIGIRDFGRPQTLNNGMAFVRNSPRGIFFLDQLLEKAAWMQTIEKDQGAFDETILEVLNLEVQESGQEGYDSECVQYVFPNAHGHHEIALYAMCWWRICEQLAGPFGARTSKVVRFMDPRIVDVNHVVGARGLSDPALLYHFAGRGKDWQEMLGFFGLERRHTGNCSKVFEFVVLKRAEQECVPGGPVVTDCEPPEVVC